MSISTFIRSHTVLATTVLIVAVAGTIIAGRVANRAKPTDTADLNIKKVSLVDVSLFKDGISKISANGIVESVSQVDLKSQISAPLGTVNVAIGDYVYAGDTLLTLQNADTQAQLDQARGALELAKGQYSSSGVSFESARKNVIDRIRDAYVKVDDIIHNQLDPMLLNNAANTPLLYSFIIDSTLSNDIRNNHIDLTYFFREWKKSIDLLSASSSDQDIITAVATASKNLTLFRNHLDNISKALNSATNITLGPDLALVTAWQSSAATGRAFINAADSSITSAASTFANARISLGSSANAQVSVAEAGVKNLEAQLTKTIIKSPISGRVAALPLRSGELASPGMLLATVVGGGGLQIKAYASGEDIARIKVGAKVLIKGTVPGIVTGIAPSVSTISKKVELKIAVTNSYNSGLVVGENVTVSIEGPTATKNQCQDTATPDCKSSGAMYLLPIQDIKIIPGEAYVFTVDGQSKVAQNLVTLGQIQGDFVEVKSGLTDTMMIISPVYQLVEGQVVVVQ